MLSINVVKAEAYGFSCARPEDVILYAAELLEWLEMHNRNYTQAQYHKITAAKDALDCVEVD